MSQIRKVLQSFLKCDGEFSYTDFVRIIGSLGYSQLATGKTSGSRRKFAHEKDHDIIMLHEPHDGIIGPGTVKKLREQLTNKGRLE